jgi:predicted DCC family thiol-disulfide oxidoreductase YuxK
MPPPLAPGATVEVFFDGDCPLCMREIRMLQRKDRHQRIAFTDIAAPAFDAEQYGTTQAELMARIHGRLPDGTWIEGVEVFRQLYAAIGWGWLVAVTRVPGVSHLLRIGYWAFAKSRLRLTGRCAPAAGGGQACAVPGAPAAP